jgi:proteic killer suppression protein
MNIEFDDERLRALYTDKEAGGGFPEGVAKRFRFVMGFVANMQDERDLQIMRGWRFEKLKGQRAHQHSLRLNDQGRLIIELRGKGPQKRIGVVAIEDYH